MPIAKNWRPRFAVWSSRRRTPARTRPAQSPNVKSSSACRNSRLRSCMMFPVAVVLVALAAPPAPAEQTPAEAFSRAEKFYAADRFGEAEPLLQAALRTEERFLKRQVYNRLMNLYVRSGR